MFASASFPSVHPRLQRCSLSGLQRCSPWSIVLFHTSQLLRGVMVAWVETGKDSSSHPNPPKGSVRSKVTGFSQFLRQGSTM